MTRQPKTTRVPRTRATQTWTEAAFWQFLRSGLRRMSMRWPPIARDAIQAARRPYVGPNKRQKWEFQCSQCGLWNMRKNVQVDHIEECGTLKSWQDFATFAERLFCEVDGLRVLCSVCHKERKA